MKTSNKILIAFASALILIPIIGMVYISQFKFKVGKYTDVPERKIENFSTATKDMVSMPLASQFESVNIADAKQSVLIIRFIKDEKFGIKIPDEYKNLITATIDGNKQLQLVFKTQPERKNGVYYHTIYVYAPSLKEVLVNNANEAYVVASVDSLQFNVKKSGSIGVGSGSHINHLSITTNEVSNLRIAEDDVKSLNLNLHDTNFTTESNSYDRLAIATSGNCEVEIMGSYNKEKKYIINHLALNTVGKANIKMEHITALNCTGSLSDETLVEMPALNLNQMFKK